ncbi:MAG: hypothetical protein Tsb0033_28820 [Winogradskyella sp.]
MPTITGKIGKTIAQQNHKRVFSKVEIIDYQNNRSFVEFRNELKHLIDGLNEGINIKVDVYIHGKLSCSGHPYNNIVATSIEKL